jgi:hypothetical protein
MAVLLPPAVVHVQRSSCQVHTAYDPVDRTPFDFSGNLLRSHAGPEPSSAHRLALARANINKVHIPPRQPLIHLAQQQGMGFDDFYEEDEEEIIVDDDSFAQPMMEPNRLSTITEKTEVRTVESRSQFGYSPSEFLVDTSRPTLGVPRASMRPMSAMTGMTGSTMDYGQPIRMCSIIRFFF